MNAHRYQLFGLSIQSTLVLPGAPVTDDVHTIPDVIVSWEDESTWDGTGWRMAPPSSPPRLPSVGANRDGATLLAWGDHLRFIISAMGDRIRVVSDPASLAFAPTVLVGFGLGYTLSMRGVVCLHGCALARGTGAISLLGDSGAGKSTVAAALVLRGAALLSDDLTVIRRTALGIVAEPGCANVRLRSASAMHLLGTEAGLARVPYIDKLLWEASSANASVTRFFTHPVPLEAVYVLDATDHTAGVEVGPRLSRLDALHRLVAARYPPCQLRSLTQEHLNQLSALTADVPLHVIRHSKRWDQLPELVERLSE
ncbi:MAG: hypothetical protein ABJF01_19165 [bacterium]